MKQKILVGNPAYFERNRKVGDEELLCVLMDFPFSCNYNCPKCYRKKNVSFDNMFIQQRKEKIRYDCSTRSCHG